MDKIYAVTSGCYSDYRIEKLFTNLEDAERYCALENAKNSWEEDGEFEFRTYWEYECKYECRVEEYPLDDVQIEMIEKPMRKRYIYTKYKDGEERIYSYGVTYANKPFVKVLEYSKDEVQVAVVTEYDVSEEKLKKIIYDAIARKRAAVNFLI